MTAVALIAVHLAVVCGSTPFLGLENLELGLLPGATAIAFALTPLHKQRTTAQNAFRRGFLITLGLAMAIDLACCLALPGLMRTPVVFYLNTIEPSLYDADHPVVYGLSLEIQGLILGLPQGLIATIGGMTTLHFERRREIKTRHRLEIAKPEPFSST